MIKWQYGTLYTERFEYNGTWMGACFVTSTLKSAVPILLR